jgi:hypothetical protein
MSNIRPISREAARFWTVDSENDAAKMAAGALALVQ